MIPTSVHNTREYYTQNRVVFAPESMTMPLSPCAKHSRARFFLRAGIYISPAPPPFRCYPPRARCACMLELHEAQLGEGDCDEKTLQGEVFYSSP